MKLRSLKFKSVKSTNDIALMLIKKDNIKPSIILSERQPKGRGTIGKKWISKSIFTSSVRTKKRNNNIILLYACDICNNINIFIEHF